MMNIKKELDKYLEFDSNELFENTDYAVIFGGAIRDIISNKPENINDIDILSLPTSTKIINDVLIKNGFTKVNLHKPELNEIYKNIQYIFEPLTFMKSPKQIVQLIRPNTRYKPISNHIESLKLTFYYLLTNVDLTPSGLFYDGSDLYESIENSYLHCKMKIYQKLPQNLMHNEIRTMLRAKKLDTQNWNNFEFINQNKIFLIERISKIHKIKNINVKNIKDFKKKMLYL